MCLASWKEVQQDPEKTLRRVSSNMICVLLPGFCRLRRKGQSLRAQTE